MASSSVAASSSSSQSSLFFPHPTSTFLLKSCQQRQLAYTQAAQALESAFNANASQPTPLTQNTYDICVIKYLENHEQFLSAIETCNQIPSASTSLKNMKEVASRIHTIVQTKLIAPSFNLATCTSLETLSSLNIDISKEYQNKIIAINQAVPKNDIPSLAENYNQSCLSHAFRAKILQKIQQITAHTLTNNNDANHPYLQANSQIEKMVNYHKNATDTLLTRFPMIAPLINYGTQMASPVNRWTAEDSALFKNEWELAFLSLQLEYPYRSHIRGDGNCFYTSLLVAYLSTPEGREHLLQLINNAPDKIASKPLAQDILTSEIDFSSSRNLLPLIHFLRQVIALHLEKSPTTYLWDAQYDKISPKEYLKSYIIRMGAYSREPAIQASSTLLNFPFEIRDFDTVGETVADGIVSPTVSQYPKDQSTEPKATLIMKGEHFFVVYKNDPTPQPDLIQFD